MVEEIKPIAELVGAHGPSTATAAEYVTGLDVLPLGRVVNDEKVTDHHAIIPTRSEHNAREDGLRRPAHLRHGGAALPGRLPPRGRVREHARGDDRTSRRRRGLAHVFRTRGKLLLVPGWRGVYDEVAADAERCRGAPEEEDEAPSSSCRG